MTAAMATTARGRDTAATRRFHKLRARVWLKTPGVRSLAEPGDLHGVIPRTGYWSSPWSLPRSIRRARPRASGRLKSTAARRATVRSSAALIVGAQARAQAAFTPAEKTSVQNLLWAAYLWHQAERQRFAPRRRGRRTRPRHPRPDRRRHPRRAEEGVGSHRLGAERFRIRLRRSGGREHRAPRAASAVLREPRHRARRHGAEQRSIRPSRQVRHHHGVAVHPAE
jgi:hypothetical protein